MPLNKYEPKVRNATADLEKNDGCTTAIIWMARILTMGLFTLIVSAAIFCFMAGPAGIFSGTMWSAIAVLLVILEVMFEAAKPKAP